MPPCHGGGRGFEPRPDRQNGSVAQLVEQRTENPRVAGSIPAGTTILIRCGGVAQLARAFGSYPECRGFESLPRYHLKITAYAFFLYKDP